MFWFCQDYRVLGLEASLKYNNPRAVHYVFKGLEGVLFTLKHNNPRFCFSFWGKKKNKMNNTIEEMMMSHLEPPKRNCNKSEPIIPVSTMR